MQLGHDVHPQALIPDLGGSLASKPSFDHQGAANTVAQDRTLSRVGVRPGA